MCYLCHEQPYVKNFRDFLIQICFTDFSFRISAICHGNWLQVRKKGYWNSFIFYIFYFGLVTHQKSHRDSHEYFFVNLGPVQRRCVISSRWMAVNFLKKYFQPHKQSTIMIVCFHRNKQTVNKYKLKFERKFSKKSHFYYESKLVICLWLVA